MSWSDSMSWSDITAVSFDLGGTLLQDPDGPATAEIGEALGVQLPTMRAYLGRSAKRTRMTPGELAGLLGGEFGRPDAVSVLEQVLIRRRQASRCPTPYPDAERTLRRLRAAGYRIAFLSNVVGAIAPERDAHPFYRLADVVLFSCDTGWVKPEAQAFHEAAERLSVRPWQLAHVGDAVGADVRGAYAAGCRGVYLDRAADPHTDPSATGDHTVITNLDSIVSLLPARPVRSKADER
jgi:putative hydrolase of the HAD superfamily